MGKIELSVQFSTAEIFLTEYVNFLVANLDTACHTILGQLD